MGFWDVGMSYRFINIVLIVDKDSVLIWWMKSLWKESYGGVMMKKCDVLNDGF